MRVFADKSGNGMGAAFNKQAYLVDELDADKLVSDSVRVNGNFNVQASGTFSATIVIERSLDDGNSFMPITAMGTPIEFVTDFSESFYEPEPQALYRIALSSYTSGVVLVRIGK